MKNNQYELNYKKLEVLTEDNDNHYTIYNILNNEDKNYYTIKKIYLDNFLDEDIEEIEKNYTILSSLNHKNIFKYLSSFKSKETFNIIMEYHGNSNLNMFIDEYKKNKKLIDPKVIYTIILDICLALKEIHKKGIVHKNLKPSNLFISDDYKIKISNFSIFKDFNNINEYSKGLIGEINYMAPELIDGKNYNNKADSWALGCILYELCTLNKCFDSELLIDLTHKIKSGNHGKIDLNFYQPELQNLIDILLNTNYEERPDINKIFELLIKYKENKEFFKEKENDFFDKVSYCILNREEGTNEIKMVIEIKDDNKFINLLNNSKDIEFIENENFIHYYKGLTELSKKNIVQLFIDDIENKYQKNLYLYKGIHDITLKFKIKLKNCNKMFKGYDNLIILDLSHFNTENVKDMSEMFSCCNNLINLDLSSFDTRKVTNMSKMFYNCNNLMNINISSFDIENVNNINGMFYNCENLKILNNCISKWNTKNITDMSYLFYGCSSLVSLPDISLWNTNNLTDISYIFYGCLSLVSLPDISKWNTINICNLSATFGNCLCLNNIPDISRWYISNVINMSYLFYGCSSLKSLPDLSKWNVNSVNNISFMFAKCSSLSYLPDISKWNTREVIDMSYLFYNCSLISTLPDISKWNISNVIDMSFMFYGCSSISVFPDISIWNTNKINNVSYMFYGCSSIKSLPDISKWNTNNLNNMEMIISQCPLLTTFPDFTKWNLPNLKDVNNNYSQLNDIGNKINLKYSIKDENLKYIPQIELIFNYSNKINENIIPQLKKEIQNLIKKIDFSIIEIKKGSLIVILALQYIILDEIRKNKNQKSNDFEKIFDTNVANKVEEISNLLKKYEFVCLGTIKTDYIDNNIINITKEGNKEKMKNKIEEIRNQNVNHNEINIYEASKNIKMEDIEKFYNKIALKASEQEKNLKVVIDNLEEFNEVFDKEIEEALKNSIFEYKIIGIYLIERDTNQYLEEKNKCENKITKILFHGTNVNSITGILSSHFNDSRVHIFGEGVYFTDSLDYTWYYAGDNNRKNFFSIPEVGDTFSIIANEIYYNKNKKEIVFNGSTRDIKVPKYGIRCAKVNYETRIMRENELSEYKNILWNEFVITEKNQILPLYAVTMKRIEYLVIWRDYNFNQNNPNNYSNNVFIKMQEFHRKIKNILTNELNSKIYFIEDTEEALNLVNRKKYNKVIIITNGNNNGKNFILKSREIIGANTISAVTAYDIRTHIQWVKDMPNVLLLNGINFHKKFFRIIINNDDNNKKLEKLNELRTEIINHYNNIEDFNFRKFDDNLLKFPNFKESGKFEDLNSSKNTLN